MKDQLAQLEDLFKALADATRLRILRLLIAGEACVCDIHETLKIPQAKASRHLAYLRRTGLVTARREGLWMHYSLSKSADPIIATIEDATTHALGHVESLRKDAARFEKRTGCCMPAPTSTDASALACCAPAAKGRE
jgi:ArsR family transcriptional regulator, arsenate/arsenite/antimonite-responsive transcriptional repressor